MQATPAVYSFEGLEEAGTKGVPKVSSRLQSQRSFSAAPREAQETTSPADRRLSTLSAGTYLPRQPTSSPLTSIEFVYVRSIQCIERAWLSYRNSRIFRLLKHAIRAAENSLPLEILRRICSKEATLLNDPCMKVNVRFRFGGGSFPPLIFFKIFLCNKNGKGVKYVSGKRMIRPSTEAARSACQLMGNRKFYDQLTVDSLQHRVNRLTDEVDVTTLKDYMKYASIVDEMPASMGGKDNSWRQLTLEALPRHTIFYDVINYLHNRTISSDLRRELPTLLMLPVTQEIQLRHIQIISTFRSASTEPLTYSPKLTLERKTYTHRRSKQARLRAQRMKMAYQDIRTLGHQRTEYAAAATSGRPSLVADEFIADDLDLLNDQAEELYEWTQGLSTPRISTAMTSTTR